MGTVVLLALLCTYNILAVSVEIIDISFDSSQSVVSLSTLYGLNQFLGSIDNITFSNPNVFKALDAIKIGQLRYPGGSPANYWSYINGNYINGTYPDYSEWIPYQQQIEQFPAQTFNAINFNKYLVKSFEIESIMWDFNVLTINETEIKYTIKYMIDNNINIKYLELGNELDHTKYSWKFPNTPDPTSYMNQMIPIINYTREISPNTNIAVIGTSKNNLQRLRNLTKYQNIFDAITIHEYFDDKQFVSNYTSTDNLTVATAYGAYYVQWISSKVIDIFKENKDLKIWITEFNFGHHSNEDASPVDSKYIHGTIHASYWISRIIESIWINNIEILNLMCWSFQVGNSWGESTSIVEFNLDTNNILKQIKFDGVAQIFAHFSYLTKNINSYKIIIQNQQYPNPSIIIFGYNISCIKAAVFGNNQTNHLIYVVINQCYDTYQIQLSNQDINNKTKQYSNVNITNYNGFDNGDWIYLSDVENVNEYPWNVPMKPFFKHMNNVSQSDHLTTVINAYDILFADFY